MTIHYSTLKIDSDLQKQYSVEVLNKYSCLMAIMNEHMEAENAINCYSKFVEAVQHANMILLPKKSRKKWDDPASDPRAIHSRKVLNIAKEKLENYHLDPSEDTRMYVDEMKGELQKSYHQVEEEILKSKIQLVESTSRQSKNKESWNLVIEITGRKKVTLVLLKAVAQKKDFLIGKDTSLIFLNSHRKLRMRLLLSKTCILYLILTQTPSLDKNSH